MGVIVPVAVTYLVSVGVGEMVAVSDGVVDGVGGK